MMDRSIPCLDFYKITLKKKPVFYCWVTHIVGVLNYIINKINSTLNETPTQLFHNVFFYVYFLTHFLCCLGNMEAYALIRFQENYHTFNKPGRQIKYKENPQI